MGSRDEVLDQTISGNIRDLEHLEEGESGASRVMTLVLVGLAATCVVFAVFATGTKRSGKAEGRPDPLAELVAQRPSPASSMRSTDLSTKDVTFPGMLSDRESSATALAAVRGEPSSREATIPVAPPPPGDRLPVVPLPAQHLVNGNQVVSRSKDSLSRAANEVASSPPPGSSTAAEGREGGYQLQVSSFKTMAEARRFADQLRSRGHRAHAVEAHVPGRGTWYRVRIGPFPTQTAATNYRSTFEQKEHLVAFMVPPTVR